MHILRRIASTTAILSCIFLVFLYVLGCFCVCLFVCCSYCCFSLLLLLFFVVVVLGMFWGKRVAGGGGGGGVLLSRFPVSKRFTICDL